MAMFKIVETDGYDGDYPNEKEVINIPYLSGEDAIAIAVILNKHANTRYWKVVDIDYVLAPGFEP